MSRDVAVSPAPATPPATVPVTSPVAPAELPPATPVLPSPQIGNSTDQLPDTEQTLQDTSQAPAVIPGFLPLATPAPVAEPPEASLLDPESATQVAPMPAMTQAAVQAQAIATQENDVRPMTPPTSKPSSADAVDAPAGQAPANATAVDAGQLSALAALATPAGKSPAPDLQKQPRAVSAASHGSEGLTALAPQPAQPDTTQAQATAQGSASSSTKDPLQQVAPATPETTRSTDPQAPQPANTPPASTTTFAVELRQATIPPQEATPTLHVPLEALAVNIARKLEKGVNQFEISLTPVELGKLDISLKIGDDGRVHAVLRAERQDTLDLLRQDARTLENQLRQAGLDVSSNALSFQLSQGQAHKYRTAMASDLHGRSGSPDDRVTDAVATTFIASRRHDGVDIHV